MKKIRRRYAASVDRINSLRPRYAASVDRISSLPDDVRLRLLSFLTTKSAVRTGILSKKWARLWTSIPVLRFVDQEFTAIGSSSFVNFVDRVLTLRRSDNIQVFRLKWKHNFDISKATSWLCYAITHNVKQIALSTLSTLKEPWILPDCIFRCPSLERLCLDPLYDAPPRHKLCILQVPTSFCWSKLRDLWLHNILAPTSFLGEVISNCPLLERLKFAAVDHAVTLLNISAPNLTLLALRCDMNVEGSRIQISTPRLKRLTLRFKSFIPEINLGELGSLQYANLICQSTTIKYCNGPKLLRILTTLRNTKSLIFERKTIEALSLVPDLSKHMPSTFCRLKYLRLVDLLNEDYLPTIIILLKSFTNLEKLEHFSRATSVQGQVFFKREWTGRWFPGNSYLDRSCNVRTGFKIDGYQGVKDEFELAKFLVKRAITLEITNLRSN